MEMAMCRLLFVKACVLAAFIVALGACGPLVLPPPPAGVPMHPGQYVRLAYFAPGFNPEDVSCTFTPFTVTPGSDAQASAFVKIFQDELVRAWQAQGLKLDHGKEAARVAGTIQHLSVKGGRLRWFSGRIIASLTIAGTITQGKQVLFAFQDQINLSSPVSPGFTAPREQDLLLRQLAREAAYHILNELLLHGRTVSG
jgi:hypothetical protein